MLVSFWPGPWLFALVSPWRVHWVVGLLLLGLPLAWLSRGRRAVTFLALPLVVGATFLPYGLGREVVLAPQDLQQRVVLANLYVGNRDLSALQRWVEQEQPEVVALLEVAPWHEPALVGWGFAHRTILPRETAFGLALLSREAPLRVEVLEAEGPFPALLAHWPHYRLLVAHPPPPVSAKLGRAGDQQLRRLAALVSQPGPPLVVVGDLNATGWDLRMRPLTDAGLREARRDGHGLLPTWPASLPVPGIPIDHLYLPPTFRCAELRRGPFVGSDHYPLSARFTYPQPAPPQPAAGD